MTKHKQKCLPKHLIKSRRITYLHMSQMRNVLSVVAKKYVLDKIHSKHIILPPLIMDYHSLNL